MLRQIMTKKKPNQPKKRKRAAEPIIVRIPNANVSNEDHPLAGQTPEARANSRQAVIAAVLARLAESHADNRIQTNAGHSDLRLFDNDTGFNESVE